MSTLNKPLVSIALCTYNGQQHLCEQLDSLVNQTYSHIEIVAVDDQSTDETYQILQRYAAKYPWIKVWQNQENRGFVKNFEHAMQLCKGEFIALSDQDDIWELTKIEQQVNAIGSNALVYHDSLCIDQNGQSLAYKLSDVYTLYEGKQPYPFFFFNCVSGHSMLFKKDLLRDIFPLDPRYFHDRWIAFIATERGGIKLINAPLVRYRQHGSSQTDLLKLKAPIGDADRFFNAKSLDWLSISAKKSLRYANYLDAILDCFNAEYTIRSRFRLYLLMSSKASILFYPVKKSWLSTLNFIRKICFLPRHS